MAEKNIFNKELGKYQTADEWDAYKKDQAKKHADWANKYYNDEYFNKYKDVGSDFEIKAGSFTDEYGNTYATGGHDIGQQLYYTDGKFDAAKYNALKDKVGDINTFRRDLYDFETGKIGYGVLNDATKQWLMDNYGYQGDASSSVDPRAAEALKHAEWANNYYNDEYFANKNKYGSQFDITAGSYTDNYGNTYATGGYDIGKQLYYDDDGKFDYDKYKALQEQVGDIRAFRKEMYAFETGEAGWNALSDSTRSWYLDNYNPAEIVAEIADDGTVTTVADITPVSPGEAPAPVVISPPAPTPVAPPASQPVTPPQATPVTPPSPPADNTVGDAGLSQVAPAPVTTPSTEQVVYGLGQKKPGTTTGYQPFDVSGLMQQYQPQLTGQLQMPVHTGQEDQEDENPYANWNQIGGYLQDPLTGRWMKAPEGYGQWSFNQGGKVMKNYNTGGVTYDDVNPGDFAGEGIGNAFQTSLGNLAKFYQQDKANQPAWYGTQYNEDTGQYDQVNDMGQTLEQYVAAGGDPNQFQGLSPIAGFNETQQASQQALTGASQAQGELAQNLGDAVQTGLSGGYGYAPNLATASTLGDATTYQAAQQGDADYVNQYLNPAVQQAQQQAIANTNASFGQGGTLGGARNARAASTAAANASLPYLTQGAAQEFQAQQGINAANQAAQNQAAQFGANVSNQFGQANQNALNQFALANQGAANQASQYNLNNIMNWANQIPTAQSAFTTQGNTLGQVGQQQQDLAQSQINQDVQAWNWAQNLPQQQLWNLLGLGQMAQAGQAGNIGYDLSGSGGGFDFGSALQQGIFGGLNSGLSQGLGGFLSGLFNEGGAVGQRPTPKPKVIRRR